MCHLGQKGRVGHITEGIVLQIAHAFIVIIFAVEVFEYMHTVGISAPNSKPLNLNIRMIHGYACLGIAHHDILLSCGPSTYY
jgi:hypothetical protein